MPDGKDGGGPDAERLRQILAALVEHRLAESLSATEKALAAWRRGEAGGLATHESGLHHAARARGLSERVARAGLEGAAALLRDALELGLIDEAEFRKLAGRGPEDVPPPPSLDDELHSGRPSPPDKRVIMDKLISEGPVLVHLDARAV